MVMLVVVGAGAAELVLLVLKIVLRQARPLRNSRHRPEEVVEHVGRIQHKNLFGFWRSSTRRKIQAFLVFTVLENQARVIFVTTNSALLIGTSTWLLCGRPYPQSREVASKGGLELYSAPPLIGRDSGTPVFRPIVRREL